MWFDKYINPPKQMRYQMKMDGDCNMAGILKIQRYVG